MNTGGIEFGVDQQLQGRVGPESVGRRPVRGKVAGLDQFGPALIVGRGGDLFDGRPHPGALILHLGEVDGEPSTLTVDRGLAELHPIRMPAGQRGSRRQCRP